MKRHRTSLKDLADELGVSIATVSRALHGSHEVGEEMRARVKALALHGFHVVLLIPYLY